MHLAQVVEILWRELDRFACEAVAKTVGLFAARDGLVKGSAIHGAVQVCQALGAVADQDGNFCAAVERQFETLEEFGTVDRVKHAGAA